jgi:hypothetical protein
METLSLTECCRRRTRLPSRQRWRTAFCHRSVRCTHGVASVPRCSRAALLASCLSDFVEHCAHQALLVSRCVHACSPPVRRKGRTPVGDVFTVPCAGRRLFRCIVRAGSQTHAPFHCRRCLRLHGADRSTRSSVSMSLSKRQSRTTGTGCPVLTCSPHGFTNAAPIPDPSTLLDKCFSSQRR